MKARGWYKGKGSHKEAVPARIVNVVRGPWGARIVVGNSEAGSRDYFELTLDPSEAVALSRKIGPEIWPSTDGPERCEVCFMNPDVCICEASTSPDGGK